MPRFDGFQPSMMEPEWELERLVRSELEPREELLWTGRPRAGRMMLRTLPIVLFAIPWTAFSVFWIAMALSFTVGFGGDADAPAPFRWFSLVFPLFGLPFLLIGLGMLSAPWWARRKAKGTCYAVTNRRAIVREPGFRGSVTVRSYRADELRGVVRTEPSDASGDLVFETEISRQRGQHDRSGRSGFFAIANVRQVEQLIRDTLLSRQETGDH
jgi:hypothetical protein